MARKFWKLSSIWDPTPSAGYSRHRVQETDDLVDAFEACRRWSEGTIRLTSTRTRQLEDFPFCLLPVMSQAAVDQLRDLLEPDGQFVPVELVKGGRLLTAHYSVFNCLKRYSVGIRENTWALGADSAAHRRTMVFDAIPRRTNAFRRRTDLTTLIVSSRVVDKLLDSALSGWMIRDLTDDSRDRTMVGQARAELSRRLMSATLAGWRVRDTKRLKWIDRTVISPHRP